MGSPSEADLTRRLKELEPFLEPRLPGAQDVAAMNARQERIDILYALARRDQSAVLRCCYTGLNEQPPF